MGSKGKRKERIGFVISDKMAKGFIVKIDRTTKHKMYRRTIRKSIRVKVHDEQNQAKTGNTVRVQETRPISRDKRWRLVEVLK